LPPKAKDGSRHDRLASSSLDPQDFSTGRGRLTSRLDALCDSFTKAQVSIEDAQRLLQDRPFSYLEHDPDFAGYSWRPISAGCWGVLDAQGRPCAKLFAPDAKHSDWTFALA